MYSQDDLLPISALQHFLFCPRQCALIHIEQAWEENLLTAQGTLLHKRVHDEKIERRKDIRIEHGVSLRSLRLGLVGKADVIEFHRQFDDVWVPFPVEYKRGRPKRDFSDDVQLCAQAMCLEEMLNIAIARGALYYGKEHRRTQIDFTETLRSKVRETAVCLHELISRGKTPKPVYQKKCETCSLLGICCPKVLANSQIVKQYLEKMLSPL